ncbi:MAG: PilW family protein [Cellvibrionales bacterium]|nr:PilW family protein [Cellvibrionales bacterium]
MGGLNPPKSPPSHQKLHRQSGLTLIEVMVSLALGIAFLTVALGSLVTAQKTWHDQDNHNRMQENARLALDILRRHVPLAGYSEQTTLHPGYIYRGPCGPINGQDLPQCSAENEYTATAKIAGDVLAIAMLSRPGQRDCRGFELKSASPADGTEAPDAPPGTRFANVFWVQPPASGRKSGTLSCRAYNIDAGQDGQFTGGTDHRILSGIDELQVKYGLVDRTTGHVDRYLDADQVESLGPANWANVRAIRLELVVSPDTEHTAEIQRTYTALIALNNWRE